MKNKNVAKCDKKMWCKVAAGVLLISALVAGAVCIVKTRQWLDEVSLNESRTSWAAAGLRHYGEVRVSDDGNWYLIPDV
ncbi:hypothetical protein FWG76_02755, partial [Candidatus Saccharibacteria bacterium]|nr:hypothetical protein [Candidatus Saccharibacteria bacterium]